MTTFSKWTSLLWNENSKLNEKSDKIQGNGSLQSLDDHSVLTGSLDSLADDSTEKYSNNASLQIPSIEKDSDSLYDSGDDLNYNDDKQLSKDECIKSDEYDSNSLPGTEQSVYDNVAGSVNSSIVNRPELQKPDDTLEDLTDLSEHDSKDPKISNDGYVKDMNDIQLSSHSLSVSSDSLASLQSNNSSILSSNDDDYLNATVLNKNNEEAVTRTLSWDINEDDEGGEGGQHDGEDDSDTELTLPVYPGYIPPTAAIDSCNKTVKLLSSCGTLDVGVDYSMIERKLHISFHAAKDLPSHDRSGNRAIQVRSVILPAKRRRFKSKIQSMHDPYFGQSWKISSTTPEDLKTLGLRVRIYGIGKIKDSLIGEAALRFDELDLIREPKLTVTLQLEPRIDVNRNDEIESPQYGNQHQQQHRLSISTLAHGGCLPELLLSLSYNSVVGRLSVEIVKGSHFRNLVHSKPPDTFVKMVLLNTQCQEMSHSKTTIRKCQPNPVYKETFYFQVAEVQLLETSLMVTVYTPRPLKGKTMIGWISLGRSSSSECEDSHWKDMINGKGQSVSRWHTLVGC